MTYDFDKPVYRKGTYSMKYDDKRFFEAFVPNIRLEDDTARFMLADMDFHCPEPITKALHRVADFGNYGYISLGGVPEFQASIIHWYQKRHGYTIAPEEIVYSCGALDGIEQTIAAFSQPGDGVVLCYPVYRNFTVSVLRLKRKVVGCHLLYDGQGNYQMDWAGFEKACADPNNKVFVLCSPHNPLGIVWKPEELARMADICRKNGVVLVSDEIHSDILRRGVTHTPILAAVEDKSNIIMVSGPNKTFNLMGLHCAFSVIQDEGLRKKFTEGYMPVQPTAFALAAMIAAYNECEDWLEQLIDYLDGNLQYAVTFLNERLPGIKVHIPDGTYILWMDFGAYGLGTPGLVQKTNIEANVCLDLGVGADPEQGENFLRLCATGSRKELAEALERLYQVFKDLPVK